MSRKLTRFEYDRILGPIRTGLERTVRDFASRAAWLTVEPLGLPPKEILLELLRADGDRPPLLRREELFAAGRKTENEEAVELTLKGMTEQGKRAFVREALCQHMDYPSAMNFLELKLRCFAGAEQSAQTLLRCPLSELRKAAKQCRLKRNKLSHDKEANREEYTEEDCRELLDKSRALLDCFREDLPQLREQREAAEAMIDQIQPLLGHPPLPLRELEQLPGFDFLYFQRTRFIRDYDPQNKILYFHEPEELRQELESWRLLQQQAARELGGKEPAWDAQEEQPTPAPSLRGWGLEQFGDYSGGHLNRAQLEELAEKAVWMADADTWRSRIGSRVLANDLAPLISRFRRVLQADWDTRAELFEIERNLSGSHSQRDSQAARQAHSIMSLMHGQGFLRYLPASDRISSSGSSLLRLAQEKPDTFFVFCTGDKALTELILQKELRNVLPLAILPTGELSMRASTAAELLRLLLGRSPASAPERSVLPTPEPTEPADKPEASKGQAPEAEARPRKAEKPERSPVSQRANGQAVPRTAENGNPQAQKADAPRERSDAPLAFTGQLPEAGDTVLAGTENRPLKLLHALGNGGEGTVYATENPDLVVKIFHREKLTRERKDKISSMVHSNPGIPQLCWPLELVKNGQGAFCGFTMRNVGGYRELGASVLLLQDKDFAAKMMPQWDRLSLVKLSRALCRVFQLMHKNHIFMGDVNPRNILVKTESAEKPDFALVDCDSYQFRDYPCPVGVLAYTSPQIFEREGDNPKFGTFLRTESDECFSFGVILFHILMLNQSPFAGKRNTDMVQALRRHLFVYRIPGESDNTGADTPDGPARLIWNNLHPEVKTCFGKLFKHGAYVPIQKWMNALDLYINGIRKEEYTRELEPVRYWDYRDPEKRMMVDFTCDSCKKAGFNMPKERFEQEKKDRQPHLCNTCRSGAVLARQEAAILRCDRCKQEFQSTVWFRFLKEDMGRSVFCEDCRESFHQYKFGRNTR